jgi:two-component system, sensor histidine kinase and response regulator
VTVRSFGKNSVRTKLTTLLVAGSSLVLLSVILSFSFYALASTRFSQANPSSIMFFAIILLLYAALGVAGLAWLLRLRINTLISEPIDQLIRKMELVSRSKDYMVRVQRRNDDELGLLYDCFNDMLAEISVRDERLALHSEELELEVADRTKEISEVNKQLAESLDTVNCAMQAAQSASRAKSNFLAQMSHEIRTPMYGVLGMTELLLNTSLSRQQLRYVQRVRHSGESLLAIINDILDFSKIEAGKMELEAIPFDLHELLHDTVEMFSPDAQAKGIDLDLEIAAELPRAFKGDPGRIRQVMVNLIGNSLKFTPDGSVKVAARMACQPNLVGIEVSDTGIGIPAEAQARIFQRFSQADQSITRKYGGTGLGLAIVRQLTELMGGELCLTSEPGTGSTFSFTVSLEPAKDELLPRERDDLYWAMVRALSIGTASAAKGSDLIPALAGSPRVLLVEDNPVNQEISQGLLESLGCTVESVDNGRSAVEAVQRTGYDLVFMDCEMPGMDGLEATRRIRGWEEATHGSDSGSMRLPIIALTAYAMKEDRLTCLASGIDDYLSKPFTREQLSRLISRHLPSGTQPRSATEREAAAKQCALDAISRDKMKAALEMIRTLPGNRGMEILQRVVEFYLNSTPDLLQSLREAESGKDAMKLKAAAHRIKSSSANLGATKLADVCQELEMLGRTGSTEGALPLLAQVEEEYKLVREALQGGSLC